MKAYQTQAKLFKILMHPTRLAILDILRGEEQCVCHIEAMLGLRQAHISQHLMVLRDAELVEDRREGWNIFYRVRKPEIYKVIDAMRIFNGERLEDYLSERDIFAYQRTCTCPKCKPSAETIDFVCLDHSLNSEGAEA